MISNETDMNVRQGMFLPVLIVSVSVLTVLTDSC